MHRWIAALILCASALAGCSALPGAGELRRSEFRVPVASTAPSMKGQTVELYVREISDPKAGQRPVVLFVHGAGTPAEVSFDSRMDDYSWMKQVAKAGFDVFSVSLTGYGRSTRPAAMANPCNVAKAQREGYVAAPCEPDHQMPLATPVSDWDDIGAVVDHLRRLRGVDKVSLVGWSQGGPRITGYTLRNPGKVDRIVVLAPAYFRDGIATPPDSLPMMADGVMTVQSRKDFVANWDRQVGCTGQYDPAAGSRIFDEMLESDGCHVGSRGPARADGADLGLREDRSGQGHHAIFDGGRRTRQASAIGTGARVVCGPWEQGQGADRAGLLFAQCHVGSAPRPIVRCHRAVAS